MSDRRFSKEDVQILFSLRTRMFDCKSNFANQYNDNMTCRICNDLTSIESEDHLLVCPTLENDVHDVKFCDVYGTITAKYNATQVFKKLMQRRKVYFEVFDKSSE